MAAPGRMQDRLVLASKLDFSFWRLQDHNAHLSRQVNRPRYFGEI